MLLNGLFRILVDMAGQFVTSDNVEFAILGHFEVGVGRLAADDADVLQVLNGLFVRIIDVHRHLQVTIAFPGKAPMGFGWLGFDQLIDEILEPVTTA